MDYSLAIMPKNHTKYSKAIYKQVVVVGVIQIHLQYNYAHGTYVIIVEYWIDGPMLLLRSMEWRQITMNYGLY